MFCGNCGKKLEEGVVFCPYCGVKPGTDNEKQTAGPKPDILKVHAGKKGKMTKKILIPIILVFCLIAGYFGYQKIVENRITSEIENVMSDVKSGPDAETMEQILSEAVTQFAGNGMISDLILSNVSGEDVADIYQSLIRYMSYEIGDVQKIESGHYQVVVKINNLNNKLVASRALDLFMERYDTDVFGMISRGISDLNSDKSRLIAELICQAADEYYAASDESCWISSENMIDIVKSDGEWAPQVDKQKLIFGCLGIEI